MTYNMNNIVSGFHRHPRNDLKISFTLPQQNPFIILRNNFGVSGEKFFSTGSYGTEVKQAARKVIINGPPARCVNML